MPQELIRESFRNIEALRCYRNGKLLSQAQLQRFIYNGIRARERTRPDHQLKNRQLLLTGEQTTITSYITHILENMAERFVEQASGKQFIVPTARFAEWQEVITEVPPLLAVCWKMLDEYDAPPLKKKVDLNNYFIKKLEPQLRHSALPTIRDPRLNELVQRIGLDDLHLHLNGSTEIEMVWRDALATPHKFSKALIGTEKIGAVTELLQHEEIDLDKDELMIRLRIAGQLRNMLVNDVLSKSANDTEGSLEAAFLAVCAQTQFNGEQPSIVDEFASYTSHISKTVKTPIALEALFLLVAFDHLKKPDTPEVFTHALYFYLLLKCQFMRLVVQQTQQYGFDQFQKITRNEMRTSVEQDYAARYHQLAYSSTSDIEVLEGRFAPKDSVEGLRATLLAIMQGYDAYRRAKHNDEYKADERSSSSLRELLKPKTDYQCRLKLSLVAHFIKRGDDELALVVKGNGLSIAWSCRHFKLRNRLEKTRRALNAIQQRYTDLADYLHGYDAASNELDAGPEVFAPLFKRLRKAGNHNFTFHAGEDYVHLLSGIRAVYEAVHFLDLKTGNRIGHGTAVGICPKLWRERLGNTVVMKQSDRLDDLVFARRLLMMKGEHHQVLPVVESKIRVLSAKVYGKAVDPEILYRAWELRYFDPILAFELKRDHQSYLREGMIKEIKDIEKLKKEDPDAFAILASYHGLGEGFDKLKEAEKLIEINSDDPEEAALNSKVIRVLQKVVLAEIRKRHIAIESLPTSNLRISFYKSFAEHHIFNWLGVGDEPDMDVPVVLGSDDPGIFSTNLRNEYAHLLIELDKRLSPMEAIAKLEQVARNGKIWRFK